MGDIYLYSDIEQGSAAEIVASLDNAGGSDVILHVNCYGGDVFEGKTIMHRLRDYSGSVTAVVEGVAASAASFIIVGGADRIVMREGSRMMVHNALSMAFGNANDLDKLSAELRGQSEDIARIYAERSGSNVDEWLEVMDKETWFTAEQAVSAGLADAVEHGKAEPVLAAARSRVMNLFKGDRSGPPESLLTPRAAAPPPPNASRSESAANTHIHPKGEERSDGMSLTKEDIVALIRDEVKSIRNEPVQISGEVEVTYPEDVKVAPTEKVTVEPIIGEGDGTTGLTFEIGTVAEGFTAEVDEAGVLSITAPAGVEPGDKAEFSVKVNDVEVPVTVEVKAVSEESAEESTGGEEQLNPAPGETVTLDMETFNEMKAAARLGWEAKNAADKKAREDEVDTWIREGRINPVRRAQVVNEMHRDPAAARALFGAIPKNTIPMAEIGYSKSDDVVRETNDKNFDARAVAAARRKEVK